MISKALVSLAAGSALASTLVSSAVATPVTLADVEGKKICWSNGNISSFIAGGKYSSPVIGDGTWSMASNGVALQTPALSAILDIDKLPDGTFKSKLENATGKYCE